MPQAVHTVVAGDGSVERAEPRRMRFDLILSLMLGSRTSHNANEPVLLDSEARAAGRRAAATIRVRTRAGCTGGRS